MKTRCILALFIVIVFVPRLEAGAPKKYGKPVTLTTKTSVSQILASPDKFNGKKVLVEGAVVNVCESRGCWIELASDKEFQSIIFKVDDGVITFPMSAKGKTATVQGVVQVTTVSREDRIDRAKKEAAESKTAFDSTAITGPKTTVRIMGDGAVIK